MDILRVPYEFRVDLDYGRATHNPPGGPPVDNPGTPKGEPTLLPRKIASRRRGVTRVYDRETQRQFGRGAGKQFGELTPEPKDDIVLPDQRIGKEPDELEEKRKRDLTGTRRYKQKMA